MSGDPLPPAAPGILGSLAQTVARSITELPPAFVALCFVNVVFLVGVLWLLRGQQADRVAVIMRVLDACMAQVGNTGRGVP